MSLVFYSWQSRPFASMGVAPYNHFSPNLALVAGFAREKFGATGGSGYVVRATKNSSANASTTPSSHGFGSAWDGTIRDDAQRARLISFMLSEVTAVVKRDMTGKWVPCAPYKTRIYDLFGIQAIHDYAGCRIWRVGRTTSANPNDWWKHQTPDRAGMGQSWAKWLHIETTPDRWEDTTPIAARLTGIGLPTSSPAPSPSVPGTTSTWMEDAVRQLTVVRNGTKDTDFDSDVRRCQALLCASGFTTAIDGAAGSATTQAIIDFQKSKSLTADGICGPQTWRALLGV